MAGEPRTTLCCPPLGDAVTGRSAEPASAGRVNRVLAVTAHPDDADFRCAGTLAGWADAGAAVTLTVLTDGRRGSHDPLMNEDEVARTRRAEQEAAAAILGLEEVRFLTGADGELEPTAALVKQVAAIIRAVQPHLVISHDPWRPYILHPDHQAAGQVAWRAVHRAGEPRLDPGALAWQVGEVWLFASDAADHVVDVSATMDRKLSALLCHVSQYESDMGFEPEDVPGRKAFCDAIGERHRAAGERIGAAAGEEFHRVVLRDGARAVPTV
jgi:LmbE family N-acetylglucosaminyl deacetylase